MRIFPGYFSCGRDCLMVPAIMDLIPNVSAVRSTIKVLRRLFQIRTCNKTIKEGQQDRPCLNPHRQMRGPCAGLISKQDYQKIVDEVCLFLEGRHEG